MARKLLLLLLSSLLFTGQAFATMSASIEWDWNSAATANMVNGGGFKAGASGVDHSTDTVAVTAWSKTDGASTASTTFTSLNATFDANIVGNVLHLVSATGTPTVGWYEVTAYTDANTITLDRESGTHTVATFNVGGALYVGNSLEDDFFEEISGANSTDGMKVWIKNGSYTPSEAISIAGAGGTQAPIKVYGYTTTHGDATTGTNRPTITQAANAFTGGVNWDFYNIIWTGTAATVWTGGGNSKVVNCKFTNTSSTVDRVAILHSSDALLFNNEAISYWGLAVQLWSSATTAVGNYVHDSNVGMGHGFTTSDHTIVNNIIADNVTAAIRYTGNDADHHLIMNNTLYGAENTIGIGISLASGVTDVFLINNIIYGFATGVSHAAVQSVGFDNYNDYNNNDTDVTNWTKGANDVTTAPGFTNVTQITGTTGAFVAGGSKLVDTNKNFTTLGVAAGEIVYITGGTGSTTKKYLIDSISTTTNPNDTLNITVPASPGTNTTADKTYQITLGHNFAITGAI